MKNLKIILFVILFVFISCKNNCEINGIEISELLKISTNKPYCELVEKAINKDEQSLKEISELRILDGAGYEHGYVLIQIIEKIGEKKYVEIIKDFSTKEKETIYSYLRVGLEYGGNKLYKNRSVEDILPILSKNLKPNN